MTGKQNVLHSGVARFMPRTLSISSIRIKPRLPSMIQGKYSTILSNVPFISITLNNIHAPNFLMNADGMSKIEFPKLG